ncbi:hypothetical protein K3495_g5212 [Podosphaera aphanis]|nr:hypothetical protein K3495_g5212 [Podosphaera aphanis]
MSPAMDKIKDTLHFSNDHSQTHTPSNNLYPEANQTKNPPRDQGLEYIGTGTKVDHGYSTETRGNSGEGPGFVDKVKDALHLNKDKNNQNNPSTSHNNTHSEYIPNTQSECSAYVANSARRQDHGEAGAHRIWATTLLGRILGIHLIITPLKVIPEAIEFKTRVPMEVCMIHQQEIPRPFQRPHKDTWVHTKAISPTGLILEWAPIWTIPQRLVEKTHGHELQFLSTTKKLGSTIAKGN